MEKEEFTSSDSSILGFDDRYKEADDDIYRALGVPRLFIEGESSGGAAKDAKIFTAMLSMLKNVMIFYEREISYILREIMVENGFKDEFPEFKFMQNRISSIKKSFIIL